MDNPKSLEHDIIKWKINVKTFQRLNLNSQISMYILKN